MEYNFKKIKIADMVLDPQNPRTFFDEEQLNELALSIKSVGILQPLVVRMTGNLDGPKYMVVCGARRYKSSQIAGLESVPATIKDLNDEQALEMMLMENLQRKDVHWMEEALGFNAFRTKNAMKPIQISIRVGKPLQYVLNCLKLATLIPELQVAALTDQLGWDSALDYVRFSEETQRYIYETHKNRNLNLSYYELSKFKGELHNAAFDLNDEKLLPGVGSCAKCQYNAANNILFPESEGKPRCTLISCFNKKMNASINIAIDKAMDEEVPILEGWYTGYGIPDCFKKVLEKTPTVIQRDYTILDEEFKSQYEDLNDFLDSKDLDQYDQDEWNSKEEYETEREKAIKEYNQLLIEEKQEFEDQQNDPEYIRCLLLTKEGEMKWVRAKVETRSKSSGSGNNPTKPASVKEKISAGEKVPVSELRAAISQCEQDIKNNDDIRKEKVFEQVYELFKDEYKDKDQSWMEQSEDVTAAEQIVMIHTLVQAGADLDRAMELGLKIDTSSSDIMETVAEYAEWNETNAGTKKGWKIIHALILQMIPAELQFKKSYRLWNIGEEASAFITWAKEKYPDEVMDIIRDLDKKYAKRKQNKEKTLEELKAKLPAPKEPKAEPKAKKAKKKD